MGALLEKPKTEKHSEAGCGNGLRYGLSSMQGWRIEMEDAHTALANLQGDLKQWSFFGVFDGHAGARVSAHCSEHLLHSIMEEEQLKTKLLAKEGLKEEDEEVDLVKRAIRRGFLKLDDAMRHMPEVASGEDKSGTTAVCSLISPSHIFVANCGDSRAVLYRRTGIGFSTKDHKPFNPCEKERIQNAGGSVMIQRVNGSLAVSRALGDFEYKNVEGKSQCEQLVSPEPELYVEKRRDEDEFLILACDGIWDVMTNEDVCDYVHSRFLVTDDVELITNQVIDTCFNKGSRDNMSVVIIAFPNAPKVDDGAVQREALLDAAIEKKVTEVCKRPGSVSMPQIMQVLDDENFDGLPPGGGLASKQELVDCLFRKLRPDCANADAPPPMEECYSEEGDGGLSRLLFLPSQSMKLKLAGLLTNPILDDTPSPPPSPTDDDGPEEIISLPINPAPPAVSISDMTFDTSPLQSKCRSPRARSPMPTLPTDPLDLLVSEPLSTLSVGSYPRPRALSPRRSLPTDALDALASEPMSTMSTSPRSSPRSSSPLTTRDQLDVYRDAGFVGRAKSPMPTRAVSPLPRRSSEVTVPIFKLTGSDNSPLLSPRMSFDDDDEDPTICPAPVAGLTDACVAFFSTTIEEMDVNELELECREQDADQPVNPALP